MDLREPTTKLREPHGLSVRASRIAAAVWHENWRVFLAAAAGGVFLAAVGAFNTDAAPLPTRLSYWVLLMLIGAVIGSVAGHFLSRRPPLGVSRLLIFVVVSLLVTAPMTLVVWWATRVFFGPAQGLSTLPDFFLPVLIISVPMTAIMMMLNLPGVATHAPQPGAGTPTIAFQQRLPPKLMGGAIWAVEAEDHYLRVRTSKGSDLILFRLADAIRELDGLEGAQVHRSWWVAKDGVAETTRDGARVSLRLKDGSVAPVSRPNVKALREAGWL